MAHMILKTCTRCSACLFECPSGSIIEGKNQFYIDADTCADHASCVVVCPVDAIVPLPAREGDGSTAEHEEEA